MKINDKNLIAFSTSGEHIDRQGYLMKKGEGSRTFSKRWFILKGNLLFYFEKKNDREPSGLIILEGSRIELAESEMDENYCFKIVFPSRSYVLAADSQLVLEQWMKCLACASYDYVKLTAEELQRQLDELSRRNEQARAVKSSQTGESTKAMSIITPTPPTRSRGSAQRFQRVPFTVLHKKYGEKVLKDQGDRWKSEHTSQLNA